MARDLLIAAGFVAAVVACDHWPGVSENGTANGNVSPSGNNTVGTCSGTPLPCGSLSGADCNANSGCKDLGSCSGTPRNSGAVCGAELSYEGCIAISGCLWAANCTGTPFGKCSAVTESACLVAKGCVFTPTGDGGAGSGSGGAANSGRCDTYGATCKSDPVCGCFLCVSKCATCPSVCGVPCLNDFDCAGASDGAGTFTPFCVGAPATVTSATTYTGSCAATR
jgi:hypothetical protein